MFYTLGGFDFLLLLISLLIQIVGFDSWVRSKGKIAQFFIILCQPHDWVGFVVHRPQCGNSSITWIHKENCAVACFILRIISHEKIKNVWRNHLLHCLRYFFITIVASSWASSNFLHLYSFYKKNSLAHLLNEFSVNSVYLSIPTLSKSNGCCNIGMRE